MDVLQLFSNLKRRKVARFAQMMKSNRMYRVLLGLGGAILPGALTGGLGLLGSGAIMTFKVGLGGIAVAVAGGAGGGAALGGAGAAIAHGVQDFANIKEPLAAKKNN